MIYKTGFDQMTFASLYAIFVGLFLIGQWAFYLAKKQVSEFKSEPVRTLFHLVAEFLTAAALVTGGCGLLTDSTWGLQVFLVSMGMLLYTVINSPGHYVQIREWFMVGVFTLLLISNLIVLRSII